MFSYFFKRLFQSILVMIVVAFVSFSLFNFVGDPVNSMTGEDASDERLKKDIVDIPYGLDVVKSLKPRKYKMKADDLEQIGFIAQEVKDIIPEVTTFTTVEHTDKENGDQYGLSYGHLTAVLTKAIQELSAKVEELESKINE